MRLFMRCEGPGLGSFGAGPRASWAIGWAAGGIALSAGLGWAQPPTTSADEDETPPPIADALDPLPAADKILEDYVKAIGGEEAFKKHTSRKMTGQFTGGGMAAALTLQSMAPDKMLFTLEPPGVGQIRQGYDGQVGWLIHPMAGPVIAQGKDLEDIRRQADFYGDLNLRSRYATFESHDRREFAGRDVYAVRAIDDEGKETFYFFDVESGLLRGEETTRDAPGMGPLTLTKRHEEYGEFDGLKIPVRTVASMMGQEQTISIDHVEFDTVDPAVFELPAEIKAKLPAEDEEAEGGEAPATQPEETDDEDDGG